MGRVAHGHLAAVALGSNLGDRRSHLDWACSRLAALLSRFRRSACFETDPVGVGPQPRFLNACAVGVFQGSARSLLETLLAIEAERGRTRPSAGAPRTLDLDLILFGQQIIDEPGLMVPHPRFRDRPFVLEPLASIAPDLVDPVTGRSVADLWQLAAAGAGSKAEGASRVEGAGPAKEPGARA